MTYVFLALWEYQCCGEPVALGQTYDWWVLDSESGTVWDAAIGARVALRAIHHAMDPGTRQVRVRVGNLWAVGARFERTGSEMGAVPGTASVAGVDVMDPWAADMSGGGGVLTPVGWIAEVEILQELPAYQPAVGRHRSPRRGA